MKHVHDFLHVRHTILRHLHLILAQVAACATGKYPGDVQLDANSAQVSQLDIGLYVRSLPVCQLCWPGKQRQSIALPNEGGKPAFKIMV